MIKAGHCSIKIQRQEFSVEAEFDIPSRGVLGIFGHSGSGKTTLLRCLAGLEKEAQGKIEFNEQTWLSETQNLSSQDRNIGYIFQEGRLFPHLNVQENLEYGTKRCTANNPSPLDRKKLFELLNINHLLDRKSQQLSGGEKQRVALGRALLKNPQIMLLDEPLASLDKKHKQEILPFLSCLHRELSIPMLYVSHNMEEVSLLCDHIIVMQQGRVQYNGRLHDALVSPESPLSKADDAAAVLDGIVAKQEKEFQLSTIQTANGNNIIVPGKTEIGQQVRVRIQASNISLCKTAISDSSILNIIKGTISAIVDESGSHVLLQINSKNDLLLARITQKSYQQLALNIGQTIYMQIKAVSIHGT